MYMYRKMTEIRRDTKCHFPFNIILQREIEILYRHFISKRAYHTFNSVAIRTSFYIVCFHVGNCTELYYINT